ncbi:reverse transcriptase domain-containing protein [Tanacetum coccineum]
MKEITTRSGVAYEGPSIPTNPFSKEVVKRETEETTDKEQTNFQGSSSKSHLRFPSISIRDTMFRKTLPKTTPIQKSDIRVSPVLVFPDSGNNVVANEENELILTRLVTGWRVCIDYRKLNEATRKDHFPLPFMDQMIERLAGNEFYCFLDGFSRYFQIPIDPQDQEKTTFTCPYGTFAYRHMPFGLCNAPGTLEAIISDRGTHFCNDQFAKVMSKYGVTNRLATSYHLQMSGQVEVSNRGLKRILERMVGENHASWKSCHLPIELEHKAYLALKHANFNLKTTGDHRKLQLNELNELRDQAYENSLIYKERTKKLHDSKIKTCIFNVGD